MAKVPRNLSGRELARALERLGYVFLRQSGSHMRYETELGGVHRITIVDDKPLKVKTLQRTLAEVANHHGISREKLVAILFD